MGGIPYTSGGCGTCRRRKVKRDETKPECLRCTKYGHQCTGYDRKRILVHGRTGTAVEKAGKLASDSNLVLFGAAKIDVPRLNANPELRSQLLTTFIESYLPPRSYLRDSTGRNLLQTLPDITGCNVILEKAGICLATVYLATQNRDNRLLQYSSNFYGNTLRNPHGRITSGTKLGPDILYTTVLLQIYELINCSPPGFGAWIAHVQGSVAIATQTSAEGEVTRRAPYLYNTQLWRNELIDLLAECSAIMEQVDRFMLTQLGGSGGKLWVPKSFAPGAVPQEDFRKALYTDLFPSPLNFPSLTCAEAIPVLIYYDSTDGGSTEKSMTTLSIGDPTAYKALAEHYAGEVCRSVLYCIQPDMKTLGAQLLLAPFSQCLQFFSVEELTAKLEWCQGVLSALPRLGLGIAPLLKYMVWPQYRDTQKRRLLAQKLVDS
ncbi:hypothetical protein BDW62DRAFT_210555 [Aspergillus aurantiobrunneus]